MTIRCPRCGGPALFDAPFAFHPQSRGRPDTGGRPLHDWGGWWVEEKYPSILGWDPPRTSAPAPHRRLGVVRCPECHLVGSHQLQWPQDAYYRWLVHGVELWAWSADHARALLAYLGSKGRDPTRFPGYTSMLRKLPAAITASKVRDDVVRRLGRSLGQTR
ncbi:MAG: hypothetical protein JOZ81_13215 [Chloroflexi bacterium]|nr:hypothetical protein [Chloroflexota bacterium]